MSPFVSFLKDVGIGALNGGVSAAERTEAGYNVGDSYITHILKQWWWAIALGVSVFFLIIFFIVKKSK